MAEQKGKRGSPSDLWGVLLGGCSGSVSDSTRGFGACKSRKWRPKAKVANAAELLGSCLPPGPSSLSSPGGFSKSKDAPFATQSGRRSIDAASFVAELGPDWARAPDEGPDSATASPSEARA